ncbi:MAG: SemiSWEET transporter [Candidatus Omnitrophica bacterium]|nr:SemiSWEET transporter [Candidatus Omnitrophota bacterium]
MDKLNLIATIAGICTTASFLPQVVKVYHTRHTKDLSLPMYVIFSCGVFLWVYYGVMIQSWPIMIANGTTFILSVYILAMKIRYK